MIDDVNAALFVFAQIGARGPAVLEITRSDFEQLRADMTRLSQFAQGLAAEKLAEAVELDFATVIGTVTVRWRDDTILGVPRFVLIEMRTGRQHAIMGVQTHTEPKPAETAEPAPQSDVLELEPVRPPTRVLH